MFLPMVCKDEPPEPSPTPKTVTPSPTSTQTPTPSPTSPISGLVPEPGHYTGSSPSVSFDVTSDQQVCDFKISVPFATGYCRLTPGCTDINDNGFSYSYLEIGAIYSITGTFTTRTSAIGGYSVSMCEGTLVSKPSKGDWDAIKWVPSVRFNNSLWILFPQRVLLNLTLLPLNFWKRQLSSLIRRWCTHPVCNV